MSSCVELVQHETHREREDQNQYQRFDAHADAPVLLHVRNIKAENRPGNVTGSKYLPTVAKIPQSSVAERRKKG